MSNFVLRRETFQKHAYLLTKRLAADYALISGIFDSQPTIYWHDVLAFEADARRGRTE